MLAELEGSDWQEAFAYAGESSRYGSANVNGVDSTRCSISPFTREDVVEIYGICEGENDGDPWRVYGKLRDNRYFYLEAGCRYTGWDCMAGGRAWVSSTRDGIIREGLTEEARRIFGLVDDNVGTIEVQAPREHGFTKITREKRGKKVEKVKKEEIVEKKKLNNSILSLEIDG
jgi:hypothetical protein